MADPYVVINGGQVVNKPEIPVFDLDVLGGSYTSGRECWDKVVALKDGMKKFPALAGYVEECEQWLIDHGQHDPSLRTIPAKPEYEDEWEDDLDDDRYHGPQSPQDRGLPR